MLAVPAGSRGDVNAGAGGRAKRRRQGLAAERGARGVSRRSRVHFVRRVITRPADPGGENHEPVTDAEFAAREFALSWSAHGLRYGIPVEATRSAPVVVANVSRGVIAEAAQRFPVRVIEVTAPPDDSGRATGGAWPGKHR